MQDTASASSYVPVDSFDAFARAVRHKVDGAAAEKGYNPSGPDGENLLYKLVLSAVPYSGHAIGEIIYKAVRYSAKKNPDELLKIAAWAFLAWKYHKQAAHLDVKLEVELPPNYPAVGKIVNQRLP